MVSHTIRTSMSLSSKDALTLILLVSLILVWSLFFPSLSAIPGPHLIRIQVFPNQTRLILRNNDQRYFSNWLIKPTHFWHLFCSLYFEILTCKVQTEPYLLYLFSFCAELLFKSNWRDNTLVIGSPSSYTVSVCLSVHLAFSLAFSSSVLKWPSSVWWKSLYSSL